MTAASLVRYFARRLAAAFLLVWLVSSAALLLTWIAPGDFAAGVHGLDADPTVVAETRQRLGLDRPLPIVYGEWVLRLLRLDFGTSFLYGRPVLDLVLDRAANTALLALPALAVATLVGIPLGVISGTRRRRSTTLGIEAASSVLLSIPPLVLTLGLVFVAVSTGWLPAGGMTSAAAGSWTPVARLGDVLAHLVVPTIALGLPVAAVLERMQSQAMAEVIGQPFVRAVLARGVSIRRTVWRHAFRVSLTPVASLYGIVAASLFSGSFAVEVVTAWPGLGLLMRDALVSRDLYLVAGTTAAGAALLAAGVLASDVLLAVADPRVVEGRRP